MTFPTAPAPRNGASRTRWAGFVRNGQRWRVDRVRRDGSLTVRLLDDSGGTGAAAVTLPAEYVREHVQLAYAITAHRAQGLTVDTAHVLADTSTTREAFCVSMTRGRHSNHAYLNLDNSSLARPDIDDLAGDLDQLTAGEVLAAIAANNAAEASAHQAIRVEQDRAESVATLAVEAETISNHAYHTAAAELLVAALGETASVRQ